MLKNVELSLELGNRERWKSFEMHGIKWLDCFEQIVGVNMNVSISVIKNSEGRSMVEKI